MTHREQMEKTRRSPSAAKRVNIKEILRSPTLRKEMLQGAAKFIVEFERSCEEEGKN